MAKLVFVITLFPAGPQCKLILIAYKDAYVNSTILSKLVTDGYEAVQCWTRGHDVLHDQLRDSQCQHKILIWCTRVPIFIIL